jgi:hypothetical protein
MPGIKLPGSPQSERPLMKITPSRKIQFMLISFLTMTISACSLITVERIDDQPQSEPSVAHIEATLVAQEAEMSRQAELLKAMATQISSLTTQNALQGTLIAHLATRGPSVSTLVYDPTPTPPILVMGSIEIADGTCCLGGTAGEEIEIQVRLTAVGLEAPVTQMRIVAGSYANMDQDLSSTLWEPYVEQRSFTYRIPINWSGFYVQVQYRDELGNLSPIYSDDISIEGMPALTPSPGR